VKGLFLEAKNLPNSEKGLLWQTHQVAGAKNSVVVEAQKKKLQTGA